MKLISFIIFAVFALRASAQNTGNYLQDEYGIVDDYNQKKVYHPAPPDYSVDDYQAPDEYPQFDNPQYVETYNPPQQESMDEIYERALAETDGQCNVKKNPHSYACTKWNYDGNGVFPWFKMDWYGALQGTWFSVTYVRPTSQKVKCAPGVFLKGENNDCEFSMKKNPDRPTQPMGVVNTGSGEMLGQMYIQGNSVGWENWRGQTTWSIPESFVQLDDYTVQFQMNTGPYVHLFRCRDFNRNSNHHFLCKWDMWFPQSNSWVHKGFMGFLTQEVWDGFIQQVQ